MLQVNLKFRRGDFQLQGELQAQNGISGIYGRSGSGKTTLLHLVCGLLKPDSGIIKLDDTVLYDSENNINIPGHRRSVGVVFQEARLLPHYSVRGNLNYGYRRQKTEKRQFEFHEVTELLQLENLLERSVRDLSGGEKQRVALGRALLSSPRLLLLDEPLASLDSMHKAQILPFLRRIREVSPLPMLYVSHDLAELLQLTDDLVIMEKGNIVARGKYMQVMHDSGVIDAVGDQNLTNVLAATCVKTDEALGLVRLKLDCPAEQNCEILAPPRDIKEGGKVYVSLRPEDIALSREKLTGTSIRNQLPGTVTGLTEYHKRALLRINIGVDVFVRVSMQTVREMQLQVGRPVICLIKAAAVRYLNS